MIHRHRHHVRTVARRSAWLLECVLSIRPLTGTGYAVLAIAAGLFVAVAMSSGAALAQQPVCDTVNRIVASGLDKQHPFAAVDALILPNAIECEAYAADDNVGGVYRCDWDLSEETLDEISDIRDDIIQAAKDLIDGFTSEAQYRAEESRLDAEIDRLRGGSEAAVQRKHKREFSSLYDAMYTCFQSGQIVDSGAYEYSREKDDDDVEYAWKKPGGCRVYLGSRAGFYWGLDFWVYC